MIFDCSVCIFLNRRARRKCFNVSVQLRFPLEDFILAVLYLCQDKARVGDMTSSARLRCAFCLLILDSARISLTRDCAMQIPVMFSGEAYKWLSIDAGSFHTCGVTGNLRFR